MNKRLTFVCDSCGDSFTDVEDNYREVIKNKCCDKPDIKIQVLGNDGDNCLISYSAYLSLKNNNIIREENNKEVLHSFPEKELLKEPIANYDISKNTKPKLKVVYDKDLKNIQNQLIEWIAEEYIPKNSIGFLGGKRGTFKSFTAIHMAYCIATGKPLFNKFPTKKTKVLYLDEENGMTLIKERAEKIKAGLEISENSEIAFVSFANLKLDSREWIERIEEFLIDFKPELIIVDSLRRFVTFEENDAGEVSKLFTEYLRPLSQKYGLTWILLHHMRKGISGKNPSDEMDELRGSSDLANYADVILLLQRNRGSNESVILKQPKNRYKQELSAKTLKLDWSEDSLKIECIGDSEESIFADEICAKLILAWIGEEQRNAFKTKDVLEAMNNKRQTKPTIERALRLLVEQGKLLKSQRGVYEINSNLKLEELNEPSKPQNHPDGNEAKESKENKPSEHSDYKDKRLLMVQDKEETNHRAINTIYSEASDGSKVKPKLCLKCGSPDVFIYAIDKWLCEKCYNESRGV